MLQEYDTEVKLYIIIIKMWVYALGLLEKIFAKNVARLYFQNMPEHFDFILPFPVL